MIVDPNNGLPEITVLTRAPFDARRSTPCLRLPPLATHAVPLYQLVPRSWSAAPHAVGRIFFSALHPDAPSTSPLRPRLRVPVTASPRAHMNDPRRLVARSPCPRPRSPCPGSPSRTIPAPSSSRLRPAPPCVCVSVPLAGRQSPRSNASTLPSPRPASPSPPRPRLGAHDRAPTSPSPEGISRRQQL